MVWAAAPNYGIVEGIVLVAGCLILLIWLLSVWLVATVVKSVAGLLGPTAASLATAIYVLATIVSVVAYVDHHDKERRRLDAENGQAAALEALAESDACRLRAGEETTAAGANPIAVFVQADRKFQWDYGLRLARGETHPDPRVQYVERFPIPRPTGAIFVEARTFEEPVPGTEGRRVRGVTVEVTNHEGSRLGNRTDIDRNHDWCLGPESPAIAARRFVKRISGVDIGVVGSPSDDLDRIPPVASPVGVIGPVETGRFKVHQQELPWTLENEYPGLTELIAANHCELPPHDSSLYNDVICGGGKTYENRFSKHSPLAGLALADGWLGAFSVRESFGADTLDVVRRHKSGAVVKRWRVRFPFVKAEDERSLRLAIDSISIDGQTLRVGLLFQSGYEYSAANGERPGYTTYYRQRRILEAQLDEPAKP